MDENINNTPNLLPGNSPREIDSKRAIVILLVIVLVVSVLFGLFFASKADTYQTTIERLNESRNTVTQLMASATAAVS